MGIKSLNLTYSFLGKEVELVSKTGIYSPSTEKYDREKIIPEDDPDEWFTVSHGIRDINASKGDKISIGLFGEKGGMFLIYNHCNNISKIFPEAVDDLYYILDIKGSNIIQNFLTERKIKQAVNNFSDSTILKKVIEKLRYK